MSFLDNIIFETSLIDFCNTETIINFIRKLEGQKHEALETLRTRLARVKNLREDNWTEESIQFFVDRHRKRYRSYITFINGQIRGLENIIRQNNEGYNRGLINSLVNQDINQLEQLFL